MGTEARRSTWHRKSGDL